MFRITLLVFISVLLHAGTAKPYSSRARGAEREFQETLRSEEFDGKQPLAVMKVEPPQDLSQIDDDTDPQMAFQRVGKKGDRPQQYLLAEEDRDEVYHPSLAQLGGAAHQPVPLKWEEQSRSRAYAHPEEDRDHLHHPSPEELTGAAHQPDPLKLEEKLGVLVYAHPEEDRDHLHHPSLEELTGAAHQPDPLKLKEKLGVQVYTHPEEDRDHLHHS